MHKIAVATIAVFSMAIIAWSFSTTSTYAKSDKASKSQLEECKKLADPKMKDECVKRAGKGQEKKEDSNSTSDSCKYKSWFKYPKNNGTYRYGADVYVRVDTENYQDIEKMDLYTNGKFVRSETSYPFEWAKGAGNSDTYLRNLKRGTYNLKVRVKTRCNNWHEYFAKFYVR